MNVHDPACDLCERDDVELTLVRVNTWYCAKHLPLFLECWPIAPDLEPFEGPPAETLRLYWRTP